MNALHPWHSLFYVGGDRNLPVTVGKGGQLSTTIAFAGHDVRTSPDQTLYVRATDHIHVLAEFVKKDGFFLHYDLTTAPSEYLRAPWFRGRDDEVIDTSNPDASAMVRILSESRRDAHEGLVEPIIFLTLSYQIPRDKMRPFKSILYGDSKKKRIASAQHDIDDFNAVASTLIEMLRDRLGHAHRLTADQTYSYYYYCLTGMWVDVDAPDYSGSPFSRLFDVQRNDDQFGNVFSVRAVNKDIHVRAITPYGMPDQIRPEYFEDMSLLGKGFRWSTRVILVPPQQVRKEYTDEWKRANESTLDWSQMIKRRAGGDGLHDPVQIQIANQAHEDVKSTYGSLFGANLTSSVIIYREKEEDAEVDADRIADFFTRKKKPCVVEDVGTKVAVAATLPGNPDYSLSTDMLADYPTVTMLPCSLPYTGPDERGGLVTVKQQVAWQFTVNRMFPARVDFGNGQNRHVTITAPVRKGKSTMVQRIISDMLANMRNPFVYMMDMDVNQSASRIAVKAMGGQVLAFSRGTAAVQPFHGIDNLERREVAKRWVQQCIRAHGLDDKHPSTLRRIEEALRLLANVPVEHRTTGQFQAFIQDHTVKQCMAPFVDGAYAPHVGGNENVIGKPPLVLIDCGGLTKNDPLAACVVSALMDAITFTVERHRGPVQFFIDEAVQVFPLIPDAIASAYKRWPKKGGGITVVLHNPKDLSEIGYAGSVIAENTGAWICLGDENAPENAAYEKHIGLTEFQRALLEEHAEDKGVFLLKSGGRVRLIDAALSKLEIWVLGQGQKEAEDRAERLDATTATYEDYCVQLLKEGGFFDEAIRLENSFGNNVARFGIAAE